MPLLLNIRIQCMRMFTPAYLRLLPLSLDLDLLLLRFLLPSYRSLLRDLPIFWGGDLGSRPFFVCACARVLVRCW